DRFSCQTCRFGRPGLTVRNEEASGSAGRSLKLAAFAPLAGPPDLLARSAPRLTRSAPPFPIRLGRIGNGAEHAARQRLRRARPGPRPNLPAFGNGRTVPCVDTLSLSTDWQAALRVKFPFTNL